MIFRKIWTCSTRRTAGTGPASNMLIKVRREPRAELQERLIKRLQAAAPVVVVRVTPLSDMRAAPSSLRSSRSIGVGLVAAFLMLMVALGLLGVLVAERDAAARARSGCAGPMGQPHVNVRRQILGEIGRDDDAWR